MIYANQTVMTNRMEPGSHRAEKSGISEKLRSVLKCLDVPFQVSENYGELRAPGGGDLPPECTLGKSRPQVQTFYTTGRACSSKVSRIVARRTGW